MRDTPEEDIHFNQAFEDEKSEKEQQEKALKLLRAVVTVAALFNPSEHGEAHKIDKAQDTLTPPSINLVDTNASENETKQLHIQASGEEGHLSLNDAKTGNRKRGKKPEGARTYQKLDDELAAQEHIEHQNLRGEQGNAMLVDYDFENFADLGEQPDGGHAYAVLDNAHNKIDVRFAGDGSVADIALNGQTLSAESIASAGHEGEQDIGILKQELTEGLKAAIVARQEEGAQEV